MIGDRKGITQKEKGKNGPPAQTGWNVRQSLIPESLARWDVWSEHSSRFLPPLPAPRPRLLQQAIKLSASIIG